MVEIKAEVPASEGKDHEMEQTRKTLARLEYYCYHIHSPISSTAVTWVTCAWKRLSTEASAWGLATKGLSSFRPQVMKSRTKTTDSIQNRIDFRIKSIYNLSNTCRIKRAFTQNHLNRSSIRNRSWSGGNRSFRQWKMSRLWWTRSRHCANALANTIWAKIDEFTTNVDFPTHKFLIDFHKFTFDENLHKLSLS